jgi:hypothetical protein
MGAKKYVVFVDPNDLVTVGDRLNLASGKNRQIKITPSFSFSI